MRCAMINSTIDSRLIYSSLAADPLMSELVEMYVAEAPSRIAEIERAYATGDRIALRTAAHRTKGAAGSYGFDELTDAAGDLEAAIRDNQPDDLVKRQLDRLVHLCRRIRPGAAPVG